ncbi:ATP-grasp domain-containing protein [Paenibacillus fonticola]|uniref:ATP-grasp domain-containing protein n=1 Tax=Paenibacillus fonticola TaxID=379896 RepID=UPI00037BDC69|nr:ATP-grasp domain-containing protein [Paenibacillus fonticola]
MEHIIFIEATITGAGLKAAQTAKNKGVYVTLFTKKGKEYYKRELGQNGILQFLDKIIDVDTNDISSLCEAANQLHQEHPITAVTTTADFYVPQAAAMAEFLQLPSMPYEAALKARNKYKMRMELKKNAPELNPPFFLVDTADKALEKALLLGYPLIMKPQDENDSLDVILIHNENELLQNFYRITSKSENRAGQVKASGGLLLEAYISGEEYSVETFQGADDQPIQLMGITKKFLIGTSRGHFIEVGHSFPVPDPQNLLFNAVSKALRILGIHSAACHSEVKFVNGQPVIIEINPRLAGGGIGSHVIELATGINPLDIVIDIARGMSPTWDVHEEYGAAIYKLTSPKNGVIKTLPDLSFLDKADIQEYDIPLKIGQEVRVPMCNADLLGYVVTKASNASEALKASKQFIESITFEIE